MGGGWCWSLQNCYDRSLGGLGSTKGWPQRIDLGAAYFSNNSAENFMYNWNKVEFIYCDGGSFSGNNATVETYNGKPLYFRGFRNLQAYATDLISNRNLSNAESVVISGCSAGGLAVFLHLDWWAELFSPKTHLVGHQDSGFFLDYNASSTPNGYGKKIRWVFNQMASKDGVNQNCVKNNPDDPAKCILAEHTSPYIQTPLFHLQPKFDAWQAICILGENDTKSVNDYGNMLEDRLQKSSLQNKNNGVFLDSCYHHCWANECWTTIKVQNQAPDEAFKKFFNAGASSSISKLEYPCSCCSPPCEWVLEDFQAIPDWC